MDPEEFGYYVDSAVASLPEQFRKKMENVEILVADYPPPNYKGLLLGLYEGIPKTKRGHYGVGPTLPDRITIFRIPILMISRSKAHAIDLIRDTVKHEIAHHFGMDEETVRRAQTRAFKRGL